MNCLNTCLSFLPLKMLIKFFEDPNLENRRDEREALLVKGREWGGVAQSLCCSASPLPHGPSPPLSTPG